MRIYRAFVLGLAVLSVVAIGIGVVLAPGPRSAAGAGTTVASSPPATVITAPVDRATDVRPDRPVAVSVTRGRLTSASVTAEDGTPLAGSLAPDGTRWRSTGPLAYGTTYRYRGTAVNPDGRPTPVTGSFATVDPAETLHATINIGDDSTVGIGAPIIVQFDGHVADKAAAQRALRVTTSVPTEGSWAWLPDDPQGSRAHWRPREYWTPGTKVAVAADMLGTPLDDGAWGEEDLTSHFAIGRAQVVEADVTSHRMVVVRDGKTVMDVPASYGLGSDPNRNTTNGVHVVMSKQALKLMSNPAYGYENVPEHWAVRISNNGEFIHANPASSGAQGEENVTHGCVNLSTANAKDYFDTAMFGDPVEVTGSPVAMDASTGDIYDWTVPWDEWTAMSALSGTTAAPPAPGPR